MTTNLFLFGGGPPFTNKLAERFRKIAKKHTGKVVVLYIFICQIKLDKISLLT